MNQQSPCLNNIDNQTQVIILFYLSFMLSKDRHLFHIFIYVNMVKASIICFILLCAALSLEETPKLPIYVGRSYDLLLGNPLSDRVDPGFQHSIFDFTYNSKETTEDGRYLIPDGVSHRKVSSCSFSTDIQTFRGTKSYQQDLKSKATISGGNKGSIEDAAFSFSSSYQHLQKSTIESNQSITHAIASCESYELSIDIFTINNLLPNFITGVKESYQSKNWDKFITQFGTHFVYEVIMGGRAVQQISYDFESVSKLSSLNIDISLAAKASFAKFFADSSFDWNKHTEQVQYSQRLSKTTSQLYIGGEPARNGNINTWVDRVIENPMPIRYKIIELSELFTKITDPSINIEEAIKQYHNALDLYCESLSCKKPVPDKPTPPPATVTEMKTKALGGTGGYPFEYKVVSTTMNSLKFLLRSASRIDKLQILLGDGVRKEYTPAQGGNGGGPEEWEVPAGQYIRQVEYRSSQEVDSLTFVTNTGVKSPSFGGGGGSYDLITFPQGYRVIGFYGRSGDRLDQLGFILGKTVYPSYASQTEVETKQTQLLTQ